MPVSFSAPGASEGGADGSFTFTRTGDTATALEVHYGMITVVGMALPSADYEYVGGTFGALTFAAGSRTATLVIHAVDDSLVEGTETVGVSVTDGSGYRGDTMGGGASIALFDNDVAAVLPTVTVVSLGDTAEGGADSAFRFYRTGGTAAALTVNYQAGGSASAGLDYTGPSSYGSVTFLAGRSDATLAVHALDDALVEGPETIAVTVACPMMGDYLYDMAGAATMTLADNDALPTGRQLTWVGADTQNVLSAANWEHRGDPMAHSTPTADDDLYFVGGSSGRDADCVLPTSLPSVKGLHLIGSYSGQVFTQDNLTVGTLELASGSIAQSSAYDGMNDLFVTELLDFRGGTLNSGATLGTVHLTGKNGVGATANLSPASGAITIGSTLSLEGLGFAGGGVGMAISVGDYAIKNGASIQVKGHSALEIGKLGSLTLPGFPPPSIGPGRVHVVVVPTVVGIENGFVIGVSSKGSAKFVGNFEGPADFEVAGTLTLKSGVTVESTFSPLDDPNPANIHHNMWVYQEGALVLENGSLLVVPDGVLIEDGTLSTIYVPGLDIHIPGFTEPLPQVAKITGRLYIDDDGIIDITEGSTAAQFGTLEVTGQVEINGAVYASLNGASNSSQCDSIVSESTIFFMYLAELHLTATQPPLDSGRTWDVMAGSEIFNLPEVALPFYYPETVNDATVLRVTYDDN